MTEEFVPDENSSVSGALEEDRPNSESGLPEQSVSAALEEDRPNCESALPEQQVVCVTVTGSPKAVRETILTLYKLGFAEVGDWSQLQRAANPKQVMSVLIRRSGSTQSKRDRTSGR